MTAVTPEQENAFYADPDNQIPQGLPVRRKTSLSEPVPVRFPDELLREVRDRAAADDRSVSNWIRRASNTNWPAAPTDTSGKTSSGTAAVMRLRPSQHSAGPAAGRAP